MSAQGTDNNAGKDRTSKILWLFYCILLVTSVIVIGRIVQWQYFWEPSDDYKEEKTYNRYRPLFSGASSKRKLAPERGVIMDCNRKILASSTPRYTIRLDCQIHKDSMAVNGFVIASGDTLTEKKWRQCTEETCQALPEILEDGRTAKSLYDTIIANRESTTRKGRRNHVLIHDIDHGTYLKVRKLPLFSMKPNLSGIKTQRKDTREYPYGALARRVIGDMRIDSENPQRNLIRGIEGQYDHVLHGTEGIQWMKMTDKGLALDPDSTSRQAVDGKDIVTTIDISIQDIADKALRKYIAEDEGIESGCVIVMDVKTGAVKAMVNLEKKDGTLREGINMAIGRSGAPGSVFKTVTLTTLLEDGMVTLDTEVPINNAILKEFPKLEKDQQLVSYMRNNPGKSTISVREGLKISSNNVFRHLVIEHYGKNQETIKQFTDRLYEYRLDGSYKFDLKEQVLGGPELRDRWSIHDLYSTAIGYSIRQTPLSILTFYNAIANKGRMMKPYLIEAFEKDGVIVKDFKPEVLSSSICSKETADSVTSALKGVISDGTARRLKGAKCEVAGKTGTSRTYLEAGDNPSKGDPFKTEDGKRKYQATFVGFFPADEPEYSAIVTVYTYLTGGNSGYGGSNHPTRVFREVVDNLWATDPQWRQEVEIKDDIPEMNAPTGYIDRRSKGGPVPDISGMGLKDALYAIENNGYKCSYEGIGHVVSQSPKAGTMYGKGKTIRIVLR